VPRSSVRHCVICGRHSSYLVTVGDSNPADVPTESINPPQSSPMCLRHAREALPDVPLPRVTLARQLAIHPALGKRNRHFEEYLVYAGLVLLFDGIFWANEVEGPSVGRLAAGLAFAVVATLILFRAYVVRLREKLGRDTAMLQVEDQQPTGT
jgi:hypothetical protein